CNTSTFTHTRFRLFRFRSPLLTESQLSSSPVGTEMFDFPTFPPHTLYIQMRSTTHNMPRGSPLRTPSAHSSFTHSSRLIARSLHTPHILRCGSRHITCRRVPPFGHPRITVRLPAPRGLSQVTASFIGS